MAPKDFHELGGRARPGGPTSRRFAKRRESKFSASFGMISLRGMIWDSSGKMWELSGRMCESSGGMWELRLIPDFWYILVVMQAAHTKSDISKAESRISYNAYGRFLKDKFGCRVYKVSVDAGFSCPNRDGTLSTAGCAYCNNDSFRPRSADRLKPVSEQMRDGMEYLRRRYGAEKFIAYFQPSTNTYAPLDVLIPLYESAIRHPDVVGLSIGTRPDCVDEAKIAWLEQLAQSHFVTLEYGLQSIYDETLRRIHRGHDFQCWLDAMQRTRNRGIWLGTHLILGFPWESREEMLQEAGILSGQGLNFLKLHHLHIVRGSALAQEYIRKPFPLPGLDEYTNLVVDFIERLSPDIYIERLFGTAPEDQLLAPAWGKSKAEIQHFIEKRFIDRHARQGRMMEAGETGKFPP